MTNILIVDDNPEDREFLRSLLTELPDIIGSVVEVTNEASCHSELEQNRGIDCVLLDYSMPGRDGLDVLQGIIERYPTIAVVMITGQGDERTAVRAIKSGAQDYLSKDRMSSLNLQRAITNSTERARLQRKVRDYHENLKSFASLLVHDLRAPLKSLNMAVDFLQEDLPDDVAAENADMLETVVTLTQRMDRLIIALKGFTEVDGQTLAFEPVDLNAVVINVQTSLASTLAERMATVSYDQELPIISASQPLLEQMFQNLISNGVKYNRSAVPEVSVTVQGAETGWAINVADNGIGIDPQALKQIFEPFKRLHDTSEFEGTGLGLATCIKIAERHGGTLTCQSEPGVGSTFTFQLPKNPSPQVLA